MKKDWILKDNRPFWAFLAGYMDSDGSWKIEKANKNNLRFRFKLATYERQVLMQIKRKLEAFNLYTCFFLERRDRRRITGLTIGISMHLESINEMMCLR